MWGCLQLAPISESPTNFFLIQKGSPKVNLILLKGKGRQQPMSKVVSSLDPTLEEGKGSGELWPNPRFLRCGTCQLAMQS